ncbi:hypothetical protein [Prochlorococcus marinus]|uniref:Putative Arenavirus glycoprotein n=1 Tax=Prochlorococcus marinus str. GP2 TaxID=59925 RepID=A0A0A1ZKB1_PROMR|nr:hypothetical protein [Prochlorococcus marinus]KGF88689.1 putative Arenavirus glycoprotein [Prochlorococcus marinus str. GP2]
MLLKNHLIKVFKKASSENNILLKESIILKWVHRFGIDSLNDLLINTPGLREYQLEENQEQITLIDEVDEEENQKQTTLMDEVDEEENQEQFKLELSKTVENIEETKSESIGLETPSSNIIFSKDRTSNNIKKPIDNQKLPLPNIKNLRKWINKDKKAS